MAPGLTALTELQRCPKGLSGVFGGQMTFSNQNPQNACKEKPEISVVVPAYLLLFRLIMKLGI
jgi:hypothetical protein